MVQFGAADAGIGVDLDHEELRYLLALDGGSLSNPQTLTAEQRRVLATNLPHPDVLSARARVYAEFCAELDSQAKELKSRSATMSARYKRIVSLSTGQSEDEVDRMADTLMQAIRSEQVQPSDDRKVELFLRMMRGIGNAKGG